MTAQAIGLSVDLDEARRFIERVFGDTPPGYLSVCHTATNAFPSLAVPTVDDAIAAIERAERTHPDGIYLRCTTMTTAPARGTRGGAGATRALVGLWSDIDFGTVGHKPSASGRPNPPNEEEAARIVDTSGLPAPSLWVHSGGGLYAWWLLDEPLELGDQLRPVAERLSSRWQEILGESAERLGYDYGTGVGDLSRVLRVPGTINRKAGGERSCFILQDTGVVYDFGDLLAAVPAPAAPPRTPAAPAAPVERPTPLPSNVSVMPGLLGGYESGTSAFDLLDQHATFGDILTGAGWVIHGGRHPAAVAQCFTRPGNPEHDCSAHTLTANPYVLVVHSEAAGLPTGGGQRLTRGRVFAHLHHNGDERAASLDLFAAMNGRPCTPAAAALPLPRNLPEPPRVTDTATPNETGDDLDDARDAHFEQQMRHNQDVAEALHRLRVQAEARQLLRREQEPASEPFDIGTLADILARPDQTAWRAEGLMPADASTLIVAQRKTGKTTLTLGLARSLLTGEQALGRFDVTPLDGNVAILNYEVSGHTLATWAANVGIPDNRLVLVNLRGRRNPLTHPDDTDALAKHLRDHDIETLIVDPFGRAYNGQSQNDSGEVGAWLINLDRFARTQVGARDLILTAHAGWNGERTRGASALEDWADSIITLTRPDDRDDDRRYLRAVGRDVDIDEDQLDYRASTRQLILTGNGSRKHAKAEDKITTLALAVVRAVTERPGINGTELADALRKDPEAPSFRKGEEAKAAELARSQGHIRTEFGGAGRPKKHFPTSPGGGPKNALAETLRDAGEVHPSNDAEKATSPNLPQSPPGEVLPTSPTSPYRGEVGGRGTPSPTNRGEVPER